MNSKDRAWQKLLLQDFNVKISSLDADIPSKQIYKDVANAKEVSKEYLEHRDDELKDSIMESLAEEFVRGGRFTSYRYLLHKLDVSVNYHGGITFLNAVELWGIRALDLLSSSKLTKYLEDEEVAIRLFEYIITESDVEMLLYVLEHDDRPNKNQSPAYESVLYLALIKCQEAEPSMHALGTLLDKDHSNINYKGKTMKKLILKTFADASLQEPVDSICYHIIFNRLYFTNTTHKFFYATMNKLLGIVGSAEVVCEQCIANAFRAGISVLMNRDPRITLQYLTEAALYPLLNETIVQTIVLQLNVENDEEDIDLYLRVGEDIVTSNFDTNIGLYNAILAAADKIDNLQDMLHSKLYTLAETLRQKHKAYSRVRNRRSSDRR